MAVIPHSNPFGSPVVMFEYMAMGKPVIAPRLGPILDVLMDNENGLLFDAGDSAGLKQKISDLCDSKTLREQIGSNARNTILSKHLWKQNAGLIIDLYEKAK
jgi:glycosyltransferase involved in cell wall biosynthesis